MIKLLMISRDPKALESSSAVSSRISEYRKLFGELYVVVMRGNVFSFLKSFVAAGRHARRMVRGDFVTAQDMESGIVALVISKLFRLKLQLQIHTDIFDPYFRRHSILDYLRFLIARILLPQADSIRVVSERIKDSVLKLQAKSYKLKASVHVLPIFVDTAVKSSAHPTDLKAKYPEFKKIVLIVSRLEKEKNLILALTAFQKMSRLEDGLGLVIAGTGRQEKWLREYARHLGIADQVRFLGWVDDTASLFKSSGLLLVTSFFEGYGMTIIEALACGCPVVSTDVGIASDAGAVIANFDPGDMALKAVGLLRSGERGELNPRFVMSKTKYLEEFKKTFV
jgi:glycosyltransferase involved in cell wall biosynthesis